MIRIVMPDGGLRADEAYGLAVLTDLSRVVVCDCPTPAAGVVTIEIGAGDAGSELIAHLTRRADHVWEVGDGVVRVSRATLQAIAGVAGAAVEQASTLRDRHDRVPSTVNLLVASQQERDPLVSRMAADFRRAVGRAAGARPVLTVAPWPEGHRWCAAFTHDVDIVALWPLFAGLRMLELARKLDLSRMFAVAGGAVRAMGSAPPVGGVRDVLAVEDASALPATWFVLCGTPSTRTVRRGDLTYRPESRRARAIIGAIREAGDEVGLHGSFATMDSPDVFAEQRARLAALVGASITGVRQHYLRMRPGATQRDIARAGFSYDATYGFPDRNGFRLGVADVVPAWDAASAQPLAIDEVPLVWMDRAQSKYQGIEDPDAWVADALALADAARETEGLWVGLWHPNLIPALGFPGAPAAYARLTRTLRDRQPFVAPLERVVAWRRLRRAVRVVACSADAVTVALPARRDEDVALENGASHVVRTIRRGDDASVTLPWTGLSSSGSAGSAR